MENTDFVIEHIDEEVQVIADQPSVVTNYPANTDFFIENIDSNVISIAHSLNIEASEVDFRPANTDFFIENIDKNVIAIAESMNLSPSEVDFRPANTDFFVENIDKNLIKIAESLSLTPYEVTIRPANTDMFIENIDKNVTLIKGSTNVVTVSGEYININLPDGGKVQSAQLNGNATQNGTPTPDAPVSIETVTGENVVKVVGKNLLKFAQDNGSATRAGVTVTVNSNNTLTIDGTATTNAWFELVDPSRFLQGVAVSSTIFEALDASQTYTLSTRIVSGSVSGTTPNITAQVGAGANDNKSATFGSSTAFTGSDGIYRMWLRINTGNVFDNCQISTQLELGSTATSYQAYTSQDYTISLGELELAKIPSTDYRDKILYDKTIGKWYIEKQVGKVTVNIANTTTFQGRMCGLYSISGKVSQPNTGALCTNATFAIRDGSYQAQEGNFYENATNFVFIGNVNDTLATLQAKYSGSTLYYALATPTVTEITNQALIDQLEALASATLNQGVNNIWTEIATGNAMPTLELVIEKY